MNNTITNRRDLRHSTWPMMSKQNSVVDHKPQNHKTTYHKKMLSKCKMALTWQEYFANSRRFGNDAIPHTGMTVAAIQRIFKKYCKLWHPDKHPHSAAARNAAKKKFQELSSHRNSAVTYYNKMNDETQNAATAYALMVREGYRLRYPERRFWSMPVVTPQLTRDLTALFHARLVSPIIARNGDVRLAWGAYPAVLAAYAQWRAMDPTPNIHWPGGANQQWAPAVELVIRCAMADMYTSSLVSNERSIGIQALRRMQEGMHPSIFPFGNEMWKMLS